MSRKIQTLDLEFDEWVNELFRDGKIDTTDFLRMLNQGRFVWDACRRRCADLCKQHGLIGISLAIVKNEDGEIING